MARDSRIDNREPRIPKHNLPALYNTSIIRPAMTLRLIHPHHDVSIAASENARDATHARKTFHTKAQRKTQRH
jgi:hypothetical protein